MNDVLPLPPAHPFSQGLPRPPTPDQLRRRTPSPTPSLSLSSKSLPPLPVPRRAPTASCAASVRSLGSLLSVPERRKRLSLHNYFLDIDIEYARSASVPRPKLIVTVVRPSPTEETFSGLERRGEKDRIGRSIPETVEVLEGIDEWEPERGDETPGAHEDHEERLSEAHEFGMIPEEERPDIVIRRKNSRESKRERRRLFHASLERLAILERMLEDTDSDLERERERRPPPGLQGGPMSAPVAHAPRLVLETDLRRAKSLEYHPYASPITSILGHAGHGAESSGESSEHLNFEYLLSPAEISEETVGRYELPALEFGPRLGISLKRDWEALVDVPPEEEDVLELGALLMPDIRGEWRHPFAAGGC